MARCVERSSIKVDQVANGVVMMDTTALPASIPSSEMTVSWLESFAFSSPRLPHLAKCALRLAFELPAATPHSALRALLVASIVTRMGLGKAGDKHSSTMAVSLKMSANNLYILHSGSSDVPRR